MRLKRRLMWWPYHGHSNTVIVGTSNHPTADKNPRSVIIRIDGNPSHAEVCLTPDGARLVAKQMSEWADFCETENHKHDVEQNPLGYKFMWRAIEEAKDAVPESAPAATAN